MNQMFYKLEIGNGPPFTFFMAPDASDQIKRFFRLESDFKGEGKATIHSLVTFDRETQKRYTIPIVVRDGGYPSLSSTCLVNVIIGDLNDNEMKDGWKDVNVFYIDMKFSEMFTPPFKRFVSMFFSIFKFIVYSI